MKNVDKKTIVSALNKAKRAYESGVRYYDDKHNTYTPASRIENILQHVSDLIGFYGLEAFDPDDTNPSHPKYSYINSGDSYNLTLVYNHEKSRFIFTDIGTLVEKETL